MQWFLNMEGICMSKTKMDLSYAFIRLLDTKKIKDVTIGDICNEGNYSRETFYYHFQNKYDLLEWMHYYQKFSFFKAYFGKEDFTNIVAMIIGDMVKIDTFYFRAFEDSENSHIEDIMTKQTIDVYSKMAMHVLNTDILSTEYELSINYSVNGAVRLIKEWFLTEHDVNVYELATFITDSFNDNLKELFLNYQRSQVT